MARVREWVRVLVRARVSEWARVLVRVWVRACRNKVREAE